MRQPDIVALCETKLHANSKFEIDGYKTVKSNLKAGKEGILVAAKNGSFNSIELVYESEMKNIATADIQYPQDTVHVIVVHGPQEGANQDEIDEFYVDLHAEVERGLEGGKRIIITGDLNARLEHDDQIVPTGNGKRLSELIRKYELKVLNVQSDTEGKWTRIQYKEGNECKSQIDYIITDAGTQKEASKTIIDEEKMYTPYRTKKVGKERAVVFSDHCSISTSIRMVKGSSVKKSRGEKIKHWVLTDEGMEKYHEMTKTDLGLNNMSQYPDPSKCTVGEGRS